MNPPYPVTFEVEYPDRQLNRLTSFFRILTAIPIVALLIVMGGVTVATDAGDTKTVVASGSALLFLPPLLMLVFREKYPRWWYDFNVELLRFHNRVGVYMTLMDDHYPSTDEQQSVRLDLPEPANLNRWLPLVKWLLAIPHYIVLVILYLGGLVAVVLAWFAILFTGRFPRGLFDYLVGVGRWTNRVTAYAFILVTDEYPPFRLAP
ncbi:MAG: hypothetical protein QOF76_2642 [Solirubrobacteraceae bacterium]|jgi:hypothetical protein|nr:hypothetical protein [Solirubrobacteraceae bacterium]